MEATVEKLEAMFLKSHADLEYVEKRLKLDFIANADQSRRPAEENPAVMLENLRAIKAKHAALCAELRDVAAAQKEAMSSIRSSLGGVMEQLQQLQHSTCVEVAPPGVAAGHVQASSECFL
ncbi:spindle and kinetochore-associated protein 2 [Brachionichthys hirsutus]|uniref:spindle and kinetochore-associated protein 2 n=1 Tax=Brachionichthys hirsutus TaxID=412623 RepID=UPI0036051514